MRQFIACVVTLVVAGGVFVGVLAPSLFAIVPANSADRQWMTLGSEKKLKYPRQLVPGDVVERDGKTYTVTSSAASGADVVVVLEKQ